MFKLARNWYDLLKDEYEKDYFKKILSFLEEEYNSKTVYPACENVFNALNYVKYEDVLVVIIGQDPYHGEKQAHGLCFSVQEGVDIPPSLQNIYKELKDDLDCSIPSHGCLTKWAKQGVLLLNSVLTVRANMAASHSKIGWQNFTTAILKLLNKREKPIVFLLWGNFAKSLSEHITNKNHLVLTAAHPSPLSAYNGFFGCRHFSKTNEFLAKNGQKQIDWQI